MGRRPRTRRWSPACARPAPSSSARRTCPSSRSAGSPSRRPSGSPATRGTRPGRRAARAGARGAAVAAGLCAAASASDGAGSIRNPAAFCNLFGLKPQRDRIPMSGGEHWHGMSVTGCVTTDGARHRDLAGRDDGASAATPGAPPAPERPYAEAAATPPGKLRVALSTKPVRAVAPPIVTDEVKQGVADAGESCAALGHDVAESDPAYGLAGSNIPTRYLAGIARGRRGGPAPRPARAAHPRLRPARRALSRRDGPWPRFARARRTRAGSTGSSTTSTCWSRPVVGEVPFAVGRWEGRGALRTLLGMSRPFCFAGSLEPHRPARRRGPDRLHRRGTAAVGPARRASQPRGPVDLASPPRSRPRSPGRSAARRSPRPGPRSSSRSSSSATVHSSRRRWAFAVIRGRAASKASLDVHRETPSSAPDSSSRRHSNDSRPSAPEVASTTRCMWATKSSTWSGCGWCVATARKMPGA